MKKLPIYLISLIILTCAKDSTEDNSSVYVAPPTNTTNPTPTPTVTQYTLTVTAGEGGSVSTTGGTYNDGTSISITATPSEGYGFSGWSNGSTEETITITLNSNNTLTANFTLIFDGDYTINRNNIQFNWRLNGFPSENHIRNTLVDVSPAFIYSHNDIPYMINVGVTDDESGSSTASSEPSPTIKFKKNEIGNWMFEKVYTDIYTWTCRSHKMVGNTITVQDGNEIGGDMKDWKGDIWHGEIGSSGNISWVKANSDQYRGFMHGVGAGDINGDGLIDVGSAPGYWNNEENKWQTAIYIQNPDKTFSWAGNLLEDDIVPFAIDFVDVVGDERAEIIYGDFGAGDPSVDTELNQIRIFSFNDESQKFELYYKSNQSDALWDVGMGANQTRSYDFNNDGIQDITSWRADYVGEGFDIFLGNSDGTYSAHFSKFFPAGTLNSSEFQVFDANNDGYLDILFEGFGNGSLFRIDPSNQYELNHGIKLNNMIWLNNGDGTFTNVENLQLTIDQPFSEFNFYPKYIIPYKDQNKLHFLAIPQNFEFNGDMISFDLYDIQINL